MAITLKEFIDELISCYLLDADQCALCLELFRMDPETGDAEIFAARLVDHQELTQFQASAALQRRSSALVIGDYHILDLIAAGGMGQVYKARHRIMKRLVAIKIMHTARATNPNLVQRFYREVEAAARLSHPNIVPAYDAGEAPGGLYMAMEYVDGVDLSVILRKVGALSVNQAINITLQVARGLAYAHRHRVIHRDIKPGNILLDRDGTVKILDMGLARFTEEEAAEVSLTMVGPLMGTVEYMAPEHAANPKNADHRSDIYSLGCTMYRLLTGRLPYGGETAVEKVIAQREHPIPLLSDIVGEIPESLQGIFARMVAKTPEDRYQSMDACLADLLKIAGQAEECDISGLTNIVSSSATTVCDETPLEAETTVGDDIKPPTTLDASQTVDEPISEAPSQPGPVESDEATVADAPREETSGHDGDESYEAETTLEDDDEPAVIESPQDQDQTHDDEPDEDETPTPVSGGTMRFVMAGLAILVGIGVAIGLRAAYFAANPNTTPGAPGGQWTSQLERVDLDSDLVSGKWDRPDDGTLMAFAGGAGHSMLTVGGAITPNYQVKTSFTRHKGLCGVGFNLPLGSGRQVSLEIDGFDGVKSVLGDPGVGVCVKKDGSVLSSGVKHECLVSVEGAGDWVRITVMLDGGELIRYEGPVGELNAAEEWARPPGRLGFGVHREVSAQIHELSIRAFADGRFVPKASAQP